MIDFETLERNLSIGDCTYISLKRLNAVKESIQKDKELADKEIEVKYSKELSELNKQAKNNQISLKNKRIEQIKREIQRFTGNALTDSPTEYERYLNIVKNNFAKLDKCYKELQELESK